ncbi:helix-turn-helix domain-containing protein [Pseudooceanicola sp. 200-1SW]|uniref:helix-turn-helix domain-containing protein n=1 Tax=Pseudooceanicola sp. 200-1SW TaxID=3425949 RepID=UPI003D7FC418
MTHQNRPYSPDDLAARWGCSGETVRSMIRDGSLPAFRVGRMYRIRPEVVEQHECANTESEDSTVASSSCGMGPMANGDVFVLTHTRPRKRSAKPAT